MDRTQIPTVIQDLAGSALDGENLITALRVFVSSLEKVVPCNALAVVAASEQPPVIVTALYETVAHAFVTDFNTKLLKKDAEVSGYDLTGRVATISHGKPCDKDGPNEALFISAYPLRTGGEHLGWVAAASPHAMPGDTEFVLQQIALLLPLILKAYRRMREVSSHDALTGLYNRRRLEEELEHALENAARRKEPLSIAIADVDSLKVVNDEHGHLMGDELLKNFADLIRNTTRKGDIYGRFGGDEFIIIMPQANADTAIKRVKNWCAAIQRHEFKLGKQSFHLSLSAGVASIDKGRFDAMTSLIASADRALYKAKKSGGKQVVMGE